MDYTRNVYHQTLCRRSYRSYRSYGPCVHFLRGFNPFRATCTHCDHALAQHVEAKVQLVLTNGLDGTYLVSIRMPRSVVWTLEKKTIEEGRSSNIEYNYVSFLKLLRRFFLEDLIRCRRPTTHNRTWKDACAMGLQASLHFAWKRHPALSPSKFDSSSASYLTL